MTHQVTMAHDTTLAGWQPTSRIAANSRSNLKALWVFTVLWNIVSGPVLVFIPPELGRQPIAAIGLVFPIAGAGLLGWAVIATLRWRRFGEIWLETTSTAASVGTTWTATLRAPLPDPAADGYTVTLKLSCLRRTVSRNNDDSNVQERILWREEAEIPAASIASGPEGASIPIRFAIPADALATTAVGKGEGVLWVLTAEAALPGVNLKEDFDVPVHGHVPGTDEPAGAGPTGAIVAPDDLARAGIVVGPSADGTMFTFAPRRNPGFASVVSAFTLFWTGALWLQWFLGFPLIFPIVTGLFDLLLIYIVIDLWLGATVVTTAAGTLRVRRSVVGSGSIRTVAAAEIARIELHIAMQTQGRFGTPYYDVRARLKNGRKVTLGTGIRNKRHAEWLADRIGGAIGVRGAA
jgi:hypothetical protein